GRRTAAFAVGGVGLAGIVAGSIAGVYTILTWKSVKSVCTSGLDANGNQPCPAGDSTHFQALAPSGQSAKLAGHISTGMFVVSGAALATGIILYVPAPSPKPSVVRAGLRLAQTPGGFAAAVEGRF